MNIHAFQLDIVWENAPANLAKIESMLRNLSPDKGDLVALPEMAFSGFSMDVVAATADSATTIGSLQKLARKFEVFLVSGVARIDDKIVPRNSAVAINPEGRIVAMYDKLHPFTLGGEPDRYAAGNTIATFQWNDFTVCPFICYDLRFPEIFRDAVRAGVNLFLVLANWPVARAEHWRTLLRARAIENQSFVMGVNRAGKDPQFAYPGNSAILDPLGVSLAEADDSNTIVSAEAALPVLLDIRQRLPFLADMRMNLK
jgi:predicted amidohydrolase